MPPQCVEAEAGTRTGVVAAWLGPPETVTGTVVLGGAATGLIRIPFSLDQTRPVRFWVRVRAPMTGARALYASLDQEDSSDAATWDVPLTPVLRWQEIHRRSTGPDSRAADDGWPGWVDAGDHTLVLAGRDPNVEIDAVCVRSPGDVPEERFPEKPVRPVTHDLASFGARGDGLTDDTAAIQKALDGLLPGDALHFPAGRFRVTAPLTLATGEVTLVGEGPSSVLFADLPVVNPDPTVIRRGLTILGRQEWGASPLLRDAAMLDRSILVGTSFTVAVGDTVQVSCDDWGPPAPYYPGLFHRNRVNYAHVTAVRPADGGKELLLDRPLLSEFLVSRRAKVEHYEPLRRVVVEKLRFEGTTFPLPEDNPDIDLVGALRCERCFFVDVSFKYGRKSNLDLFRSFETQVVRAEVSDVVDTGGNGHGYGITMNRSQALVIRDSLFFGVIRHAIPISWGSREGFAFRNRFDRSVPHTNRIASVDLHGQDDYANLVEANVMVGGQPGIIVGGGGTSHGNDGPWNVIRGNYLESTTDGIAVYKSTYDTIIEGNEVRRPGAFGVRIESGSDRTLVRSNTLAGYTGAGIEVADSDRVDIRLNRFVPGVGPAVLVRNSLDYTVVENSLGGAAVDHPGTGTVGDNL